MGLQPTGELTLACTNAEQVVSEIIIQCCITAHRNRVQSSNGSFLVWEENSNLLSLSLVEVGHGRVIVWLSFELTVIVC